MCNMGMAAAASLSSEGGQGQQAAELVNVSHVTVIKQIGRGGFARVYSAEYHPPGRGRRKAALKVSLLQGLAITGARALVKRVVASVPTAKSGISTYSQPSFMPAGPEAPG